MFLSANPRSVLCASQLTQIWSPWPRGTLRSAQSCYPDSSTLGQGIHTLCDAAPPLLRPEASLMLLPAWPEGRLGSSEDHSGALCLPSDRPFVLSALHTATSSIPASYSDLGTLWLPLAGCSLRSCSNGLRPRAAVPLLSFSQQPWYLPGRGSCVEAQPAPPHPVTWAGLPWPACWRPASCLPDSVQLFLWGWHECSHSALSP